MSMRTVDRGTANALRLRSSRNRRRAYDSRTASKQRTAGQPSRWLTPYAAHMPCAAARICASVSSVSLCACNNVAIASASQSPLASVTAARATSPGGMPPHGLDSGDARARICDGSASNWRHSASSTPAPPCNEATTPASTTLTP
ncbi:hypothetical protein DWV92_00880 [Bifidobacterium pseudolongum]|uniref:Uncharacterized protein n=1 Tax=Bifidobacterium pseudolongum TaxID=1694 RepID=A0A395XFE5_9BIFI|nr:hypothetical protein DWV92_00880 [Bifidobacterium pseudolongum]